ncbi:ABC transporter substrate-binding protein [Mesorhizobium sp. Cs1299R1N1]|uniref:ABC transporter substrate-binding protein n=1 Tax=Mesorhizobium sp. Cs1299R1N1 TaxID=3015172 RepID=UPI00301C6C33
MSTQSPFRCDGTSVTARDCVPSIRRWAQVETGGQMITERARDISSKDEKTFTLKEPLGTPTDLLAKVSEPVPFIMQKKDAERRPATEQVTTNVGSRPFKFNQALAKPGSSFTYERNVQYVPRIEPSDGFASGKVVKVDRVVWENIADQQTSFAALQAGEVDFMSTPSADLYPAIESDPNLALQVVNLRMSHLQKPFDNVKARQAMLYLIDQEAFLRVIAPDLKYAHTLTSIFGNNTRYSIDENIDWFKKGGDPEKAKQLFQEAGYAGEKVDILDPTDWAQAHAGAQLLAATLQKIGINAELTTSDWGGIVARRANRGPVESGGWSIFITNDPDFVQGDPISAPFLAANGDKAWYGWPKNDEYEALRSKWEDVANLEERQALARKMQSTWWNFVGDVRLGQIVEPIARSKMLTGLIEMPALLAMWNMKKGQG